LNRPSNDSDWLSSVADEYRKRGYSVLLEPRGADLPEFLRNYQPDLIALREDDRVIVEFKRDTKTTEPLEPLAKEARRHGWRLELLRMERTEEPEVDRAAGFLRTSAIKDRISEAKELVLNGHEQAALLLAWSAFEALVNVALTRKGASLARHSPRDIIAAATTMGMIDQGDGVDLAHYANLRNLIVHGQPLKSVSKAEVTSFLQAVDRMVA
jgi:uncharacterized protein YutE (UPF0331/DUF86 family)